MRLGPRIPSGGRRNSACRWVRALSARTSRSRAAAARVSTRLVATRGVAGQSVVGDRLPRRGIGHELTDARPDPRIIVERPHPDADRIGVIGIAAKERRAALAAEPFLAAVVGLPHSKPVRTRNDPKCSARGVGVRRRRRSCPALAALAMAIAGDDERRGHLESDGPAVATTREREVVHLRKRLPPSVLGTDTNTTAHRRLDAVARCRAQTRSRRAPRSSARSRAWRPSLAARRAARFSRSGRCASRGDGGPPGHGH
jgi:hypothetical protein